MSHNAADTGGRGKGIVHGMSLSTAFGFLAGIGLFIWSIWLSTDNWIIFVNWPSVVMVFGGTFAATFVSFEARYVWQALRLTGTIFLNHRINRAVLHQEVGRVIRWGYIVQRLGMPALEADAHAVRRSEPLTGFGIDLVVTGYSGKEVRETLANTIEASFQRATVPADILRSMAGTAPAFGMIGTVVGLVIMLDSMASNPERLGPGMAVALITTLYGILFARLILLPTASKIQQREEIQRFRNYLLAEGLALLAERKSPRYIQDRMNSHLDPALHFDIDRQMRMPPAAAKAEIRATP